MRKNPTPVVHVAHEIHGIIQWVPPIEMLKWEPQRTCDLRSLPKIDLNWIKLEFRPFADQIENLPEHERKLFTVALGTRRDGVNIIMENTLSKIRRHKYDRTSLEYTIAVYTIKIRNYQYLMGLEPRTTRAASSQKRFLNLIIDKRKKYLSQLRVQDYKRFEWVIQILGVLYKPRPHILPRIKRKECFSTLTDMYCEDIIKKKMELYKTELEGQKIPFLEEKLDTLKKIKADEDSMRIPCSVEDEIIQTEKRLEVLTKSCLDITPKQSPKEISA